MTPVEEAIQGKRMALPDDRMIGLRILEGADAGHAFVLSKKCRITFGRDGADLDVQDPAVSKLHCAIEVYGDVIVLRDLGSASGTFLNDFQIKDELLKDKDNIRLGGTAIQIHVKKKK
ncbi:MAG: FHA domain-containing protein [Nitrospirae bacterium]|nr:FHA domain-containing protein [Nitrospirota bacterium]